MAGIKKNLTIEGKKSFSRDYCDTFTSQLPYLLFVITIWQKPYDIREKSINFSDWQKTTLLRNKNPVTLTVGTL